MSKIIFPGSFDPVTIGHIDLIKRASKQFDEVVVLVVDGTKNTMFSIEKRVEFVNDSINELSLTNVSVEKYDNLVVRYCEENNVKLILRGLRNITDLAYEHNMVIHNRSLDEEIETICLLGKPEHFHISSSSVRELIKFKADISKLVTKTVNKSITRSYDETL